LEGYPQVDNVIRAFNVVFVHVQSSRHLHWYLVSLQDACFCLHDLWNLMKSYCRLDDSHFLKLNLNDGISNECFWMVSAYMTMTKHIYTTPMFVPWTAMFVLVFVLMKLLKRGKNRIFLLKSNTCSLDSLLLKYIQNHVAKTIVRNIFRITKLKPCVINYMWKVEYMSASCAFWKRTSNHTKTRQGRSG